MIWEYFFPALFGTAVFVQFIYLLFVFTALAGYRGEEDNEEERDLPGVSVVVAAWNEIKNLQELIPLLAEQDYPDFEIIIVDDRSSDGTYDYLLDIHNAFPNVRFVHVKALPEHFTAKKYAVTMGLKKAQKEVVLLTDADCRPNSKYWIREMAEALGPDKEVVLGFSPYYEYPGRLNAFIRYETFQTALQYFSFARVGVPFMGVGRNLMYRKEAFWAVNGFTKHLALLSGDDDLLINEIAHSKNTAICISEESHVYSEPKRTFKEWVTQKRRHLSVGKRYKFRDKLTIGLLWFSFILVWFSFVPALLSAPAWFVMPKWLIVPNEWLAPYGIEHYEPITNWMRVVLGVFLAWLLLRWLILSLCNRKLGKTVRAGKILYYDFLYWLYLVVFGLMTLISNPKKIKWR
ncbi:glycosyltransferase [Marinilongibacter aquaticus]|uniref:glycosyltransferase n=1 Tax=Marinilongibacter aquaticus TaxID=2975157 RepID=UPI0021BDAFA8|nr:glycosyltransferase [Marinilongibacter aquaticus]UBM60969.1 glycosyltransferase [Marinilongibacter aquaticus]